MKLPLRIVLDVALSGVILRFLMGWLLSNRRIAGLVIILLGLSGFVLAVSRFHMPLTQILTATLAVPIALLLVLIFLPELRHAYQTASVPTFFGARKRRSSEIVPMLTRTLLELAANRRGALLVFPQRDDIEGLIDGGEEYQAKATTSLFLSLLHPACPRHDGAIIIRGNNIVHVGAVLPLASAAKAKEGWGTRHLAAIGLTKQCDADVFIISEERGTISLARNGEISVVIPATEEAVSQTLHSVLNPDHPASPRKSGRFFSIGLWLVAFAIAGAMALLLSWLNPAQFSADANKFVVAQAPIYFANIPSRLYIGRYSASSCQVYLRLPPQETNLFKPDLSVTVDLKDYPPGPSVVTLTQKMLYGLPENWKTDRYDPEIIKIELAQAREATLAIKPKFTGLKPELKIASSSVTPASAKVSIKDDQTTKLETAHVNLANVLKPGPYTFTVPVEFPASVTPEEGTKEQTVSVKITVTNSGQLKP
ncbi:MAG: DNA integrity scanning protein DisA nucleotide-binding domain protein [bacterium]